MTDNTKKKLSAIKLPAELHYALKREIHERFARGEVEPTFGDLLSEAWRAYKSIPKAGDSAPPKARGKTVPTGLAYLIAELEEILSSGDTEAIKAVQANIDLFHSRLRPTASVREKHPRQAEGQK